MRTLAPALALLLAACGVPDGKLLVELTPEQALSVCEDLPVTEFTCTDGDSTFTLSFGGSCEDDNPADDVPAECPVTVGDMRDCGEAFAAATEAEICAGDLPEACAPLFDAACLPVDQ